MNATPESNGTAGSSHLLKVLGVTFGVAVTIGSMIGLGILRTPGLVAAQIPYAPLILLIWLLGACYALLGTLAAAELSTSIPKTGGWYAFTRRAFGEYPGFLVGWMDWIAYPVGLAVTALTIGEYVEAFVPGLSSGKTWIGLSSAIVLGILNWAGLKVGGIVQELTSLAKALALLVIVAGCFVFGATQSQPQTEAASTIAAPLGIVATFGAIVIALQSVIFTYDGWHNASYFAEENENPGRSLPRAMIIGVLSVAGIYLLVNAALLFVLEIPQMANSILPVADAAALVFGDHGKTLVTAFAIISLLGVMNASMMIGPRIMFAISRDGLFTKMGATVNEGGTPTFALFLTIAATVFLILIGSFETLLAISAFMFVLGYLAGFLSVIAVRRREPDLDRPFVMPFFPLTITILLVASVAFLVGAILADTMNAVYTLILMILSFPAFLFTKRLKHAASS